jgi:endonuclease YncB( thermonuclease family)
MALFPTWTRAVAAAWLVAATGPVLADEIPGPVMAEVVRVIDGDTFEARIRIWLDLELTANVRIRGIDAPEIRGGCQSEKDMAAIATQRLAAVAVGEIILTHVADDKYFGRVVADVRAADGTDLASAMLASGVARPYDGGTRGGWCELASLGG